MRFKVFKAFQFSINILVFNMTLNAEDVTEFSTIYDGNGNGEDEILRVLHPENEL